MQNPFDKKSTPMMEQWHQCKKKAKDALLLFRLGDFYEAFYEDAKVISQAIDLTLTKRQGIPMSGVPFHTIERTVEKLVSKGFLVAIAEQVEDPKQAKGIVKRDVVRIVSPATIVNSSLVEDKANNYFGCITRINQVFGLSFLDLSTGEFCTLESASQKEILDELYRRRPSEILLSKKFHQSFSDFLQEMKWHFSFRLTVQEDFQFDHSLAFETLSHHLQVASLDGFGLQGMNSSIIASGALLAYVKEELQNPSSHIQSIKRESLSSYMAIDRATQRNLELLSPMQTSQESLTLFSLLDHTMTPMGGRLLKHWLTHPLLDISAILQRQDSVEELLSHPHSLKEHVKKIRDLERIIMRIHMNQCTPRDLVHLRFSLEEVPAIFNQLQFLQTSLTQEICSSLDNVDDITAMIREALVEEPPLRLSEGQLFKHGYHAKLDELYELSHNSKQFMANYQTRLREKLGLKTLKVSYSKAFGYFIEVSRAQAEKMPDTFIRRQTLVNNERFISPELKEYENQIFSAEQQMTELEQKLYAELKANIRKEKDRVLQIARALATLDVLLSFASAAKQHAFVRPKIDDSDAIEIKEGRHPVVEATMSSHTFIPNDTHLNEQENRLIILTGPNMAGKSTYIRQIALLVIMAQMGSFIPARFARMGVVDRLYSRIGASDDLSRGYSTFMVEMMETANILHNATRKSLVILDEIGRGTSTHDGISIASATSEYLLNTIRCKTLFATHYFELTELEKKFSGVKNYTVGIEETHETITFLRKIIPGSADKSYGIHVARLAGLPSVVIQKAEKILLELEKTPKKKKIPEQLSFLPAHPLLQVLKELDLNQMTPIEAINFLMKWKNEV